jgi:hypothetical protein
MSDIDAEYRALQHAEERRPFPVDLEELLRDLDTNALTGAQL